MRTIYACYGLISLHVNFHDNRTKWTVFSNIKICRWGGGGGEGKRAFLSIKGGGGGITEKRPFSQIVLGCLLQSSQKVYHLVFMEILRDLLMALSHEQHRILRPNITKNITKSEKPYSSFPRLVKIRYEIGRQLSTPPTFEFQFWRTVLKLP